MRQKELRWNKKIFRKNLGFYTEDGDYNLLAQLLANNSHIPILFGHFTGINKASTIYSAREFDNTCLLYSLDDVLQYADVLNIPQADERNRIVERKEVMLFDQFLVFERRNRCGSIWFLWAIRAGSPWRFRISRPTGSRNTSRLNSRFPAECCWRICYIFGQYFRVTGKPTGFRRHGLK